MGKKKKNHKDYLREEVESNAGVENEDKEPQPALWPYMWGGG